MNHTLTFFLFAMLILPPPAAFSQDECKGLTWPEDPALKSMANNKYALYTDELNAGNYERAAGPFGWFLNNHPQLGTTLYIHGAAIYNGRLDNTSDDKIKQALLDSLMIIYDLRMQYYNNTAEVTARKAFDHYKHTIRDPNLLEKNLELFDLALNLNDGNIPSFLIIPYLQVIKLNKQINNNLTMEEVMERYNRLSLVMEADEDVNPRITATAESLYLETIAGENMDCDMIKDQFGERFRADPSNQKMAKLVFKLMLKGECTQDPLWLEAGRIVAEGDPGYKIYNVLGSVALSTGEFAQAEEFYENALKYAFTNQEISEANFNLGNVKAEQGLKPIATAFYREAISADPGNKKAYNAIGMLYFNSYEECRENKNKVRDRSVYLAAYDKFIQGGNEQLAAAAKEQFPSKVDVFDWDLEVGQEINTDCWMNEMVAIRTRD